MHPSSPLSPSASTTSSVLAEEAADITTRGHGTTHRTFENYVKLWMEYVNTSSTKLSLVFEVAIVAEQDAFVISKLFGVYLKTYPRRETERRTSWTHLATRRLTSSSRIPRKSQFAVKMKQSGEMKKRGLVYRRTYDKDGPCPQSRVREENEMPNVRFPVSRSTKFLYCSPNIYTSNSAKHVFQLNTNTNLILYGPAFSLSAGTSISCFKNVSKSAPPKKSR